MCYLPPFPLNFDYNIFDDNTEFFEKIAYDYTNKEDVLAYFGYEKMSALTPQVLWEEEGLVRLSEIGRILWGKYNQMNPLIYWSRDVQKAIEKDKELETYIIKMLKGQGENDHQLKQYKGKAKCYKFSAKSHRIFYLKEEGKPYRIAQIFPHDEYERYIDLPNHDETTLEYSTHRVKM